MIVLDTTILYDAADENLPRKLAVALRAEGREVESVHTLQLQALEDG